MFVTVTPEEVGNPSGDSKSVLGNISADTHQQGRPHPRLTVLFRVNNPAFHLPFVERKSETVLFSQHCTGFFSDWSITIEENVCVWF